MNSPDPRLNPHLEAALQRIRTAAEQAAERCAEGLGLSALSAGQIKRRDALLSAQFVFRKQQAQFGQRFHQSLHKQLLSEQARQPEPAAWGGGSSGGSAGKKDWTELSLMDDDAVDALVAADRIGLAIGHQCEWELRDVESYVFGLNMGERNPLRPELVAQALIEAVQTISDDAQTRDILTDEMTRALAQEMRACYGDIAELFRSRGLRPQDLRVRGADSQGHGATSRHQTLGGPSVHGDFRTTGPGVHGGHGGYGGSTGYGGQGGPTSGHGGWTGAGTPRGGRPMPGAMGVVDAQMMDLLRRLTQLPPAGPSTGGGGFSTSGYADSGFALPGEAGIGAGAMLAGGDFGEATLPAALPANLIHLHRDELRQAATGRLDHMVIDVVGSLFDQILSDPKVPPQMARLIARLQLPVLRAALGDQTFFSSRRHPVRRFVNRMASLACAFDDFNEGPGQAFLAHVRELVQDVANGDFERMDVYERKLDELEKFIAEQTAQTLKAKGDAAALVERKETDLRLQQRYMQQLQGALVPVPMADFLREFLAQVWSQAIVLASRDGTAEQALRLRQLGRELVMSVQPKGGPDQRKIFLSQLPSLMRTLNEGLDLIAWPEPARKEFFGQLLPAHAESLKGQAPTALETNLLIKQLDQVFGCAPPVEQDLTPSDAPVTVPGELDMGSRLTPAEAKSLGLVNEAAVDWNGQIDIDLELGADPAPLEAVDISIDGLPAATDAPEPSKGGLLIDHLQVGYAYEMNTGDSWHKVRLAHISAGRSFFIFTQGSKHQETVTMTARMLKRLCESNRLKAFEHAALIERATARARAQLAALSAGSASTSKV